MLPFLLATVWILASFTISFAFPLESVGRSWGDDEPHWKLVGLAIAAFLFWPLSLFFAPFFPSYYPPEDRSVDEHVKHRFLWALFAPFLLFFAADGISISD